MDDPLMQLNHTELLQLISAPERGGLRLKRSVSKERLIHFLRTGEAPQPEEFVDTIHTRSSLQGWISQNWQAINSQLPCSGETKGCCTVHPCSEIEHLNCFRSAKVHMV